MAILFSNEILNSIKNELKTATNSVQIITAYCKEASLKYLNRYINEEVVHKRLLVRFRMDDVLNGSTDFSILAYGIKNGWDIYIRFDLHAKTYIIDNKRGFVGSANVTNSGLSIGKSGNMEIATLVDVEQEDIKKISQLFNGAIHVNYELIDKMKNQIDTVQKHATEGNHSWDTSITDLFTPHITVLFSCELPEAFSINEGEYFSFMDEIYRGDLTELKKSFRWSNVYLWLLSILEENDGCIYFGTLSEKLHNAMVSDPKLYRREVKVMLANLLSLIETLEMEEIIIDRPNYSQRVRLSDSYNTRNS